MYTYEDKPKHKVPKKKASSRSSECVQKYAPKDLTPGFSNKHMFRPLTAHSLAYSSGVPITDSTLVKLPGGRRDLMDLYEAATNTITTPGDVDFEVPAVEYNGKAVSDSTTAVNRYLQFTTDDAGRICHLENPSSTPADHSYITLQTKLLDIRDKRKNAMNTAIRARQAQFNERISIDTVNGWIQKINGVQMDPVTLNGNPDIALRLNSILNEIIDMNDFFTTLTKRVFDNVNGELINKNIRDWLISKKNGKVADMIESSIQNLGLLKENIIEMENENQAPYTDDLEFTQTLIEDINLYNTKLDALKQRIKGYDITDLTGWIDAGITDTQFAIIKDGINYSGIYM